MKKLLVYSFFLLLTTPMSHVVAVVDSHTLIVERTHERFTVHLAGVDVPPEAETAAKQFLVRELLSRWVFIEAAPNGASYVYRSPDSLDVNRAVIAEWLNGPSTHNATMLGWSSPSARTPATRAAASPPKAAAASKPKAKARSSRRK
jgi:hypothetical protein